MNTVGAECAVPSFQRSHLMHMLGELSPERRRKGRYLHDVLIILGFLEPLPHPHFGPKYSTKSKSNLDSPPLSVRAVILQVGKQVGVFRLLDLSMCKSFCIICPRKTTLQTLRYE